jgi:hypothetical protein
VLDKNRRERATLKGVKLKGKIGHRKGHGKKGAVNSVQDTSKGDEENTKVDVLEIREIMHC